MTRNSVQYLLGQRDEFRRGANRELKDLYALVESESFKKGVHAYANTKRITCHFNPPLAPHFRRIWEAAVKSFKHHFKRVDGDRIFTLEELNTFAIEIEVILNSRPLCLVSSYPNGPIALTPAHFLIGQALMMLPENNVLSVAENRLNSWRLILKICQDFWKHWQQKYLNELQKQQKWVKDELNLECGKVVLFMDKNQLCSR